MVVFTCNHCGESLHKPKVEKHYAFVCRRVKFLTCVDCFKDFREEEYASHTKCLTEEQRYSAKGTVPNGVVKKGELKQESWVDMIKSIIEKETNLRPSQRNLLQTISNYDNTPRKKPKFFNFIKSCLGGRVNMKDVEECWNIIEKYKISNAQKTTNGSSDNTQKQNTTNGSSEPPSVKEESTKKRKSNDIAEEPIKKKKKHSTKENDSTDIVVETTDVTQTEEVQKFDFNSKILSILENKGTVSLKKLEKKVVNAYLKHKGLTEATPKITKKFNKKLKNIQNIEIVGENATLK
ncbi:unnamed protein product [Phyllotreta striolata]|uniref:Cell growth-regulating nucleolar protein n=1 Tax=Phyllotreta striolata TaxID=444603 RepID=A0A9N9TXS2_PHYSR|nr:unnamed protein product [Phyllotreta striolata]